MNKKQITGERYSAPLAVKEHLLRGEKISVLEAYLLFGLQSLGPELKRIKDDGFLIGHARVPMDKILWRINKYTLCEAPRDLPTLEILVSEYWIKK